MELDLVRLTEADLPGVLELERLVYKQPWTESNFRGEFDRSLTLPLGYKDETLVAGYCFFWLLGPEIHLLNLAVRPEYRRRGLARSLLANMIAVGRRAGVGEVFLEVRHTNQPALSLYQSLGFTLAGRRPDYYDDGEDAAQMTLIL
jgi:ribosomal-protein-alanine N-acetyltransferase